MGVWFCFVVGFGSDEAGPSGVNDYAEQEENADKMENDEDSAQVHFLAVCPPGRLDKARWDIHLVFFRKTLAFLKKKIRLHIHISTPLKGSTLTNITNAGASTHSSISHKDKDTSNPWHKHSKNIFLLLLWIFSMAFMTTEFEKETHHKLLSIYSNDTKCKLNQAKYVRTVCTCVELIFQHICCQECSMVSRFNWACKGHFWMMITMTLQIKWQ